MKKASLEQDPLDHYIGCFGEFNVEDTICKQVCALRLRCAIDSSQKQRMSLIDDLFNGDEMLLKLN